MRFADQYIQEKSIEIYAALKNRKIIYLDLKYWIMIRDSDKETGGIALELAQKITELYDTGKCIFPLSESVLLEILKQADPNSRKATLVLVEKLSDGIAIIGDRQRIRTEFSQWILRKQSPNSQLRTEQLVWSSLNMVMGYFFYADKVTELPMAMKRSFMDLAYHGSFSALLDSQPEAFISFKGKDDIDALNEGKIKHQHENKNFKEIFLSELGGFIELFSDDFNSVMADLFYRRTGKYPSGSEYRLNGGDQWCNLIYNAFKAEKLLGTELPAFKIFPSLFASMRSNIDRKYKDGNDTLDVLHATAALPYCDYFFTEKELKTMISQQKLDQTFKCITESNPNEVLKLLNLIT